MTQADRKMTQRIGKEEQGQVVELSDVYEVAYLRLCRVNYDKVHVDEKGRVRFSFANPALVKERIKSFYSGEAKVEPRAFKHAIQDIRSIIYSLHQASSG